MANDQIMINWAERLIWCNTCARWVAARHILIDGSHDDFPRGERSAHKIWEEA